MDARDRITVLGTLLVEFDQEIDRLDRAVFEAAHGLTGGGSGMDVQRDRAMSPDFQPAVKTERDRKMLQRNALAGLLGFQCRGQHDLSPRDYLVQKDGTLEPR